ncbi:MAG: hypothetical protein E3K32_13855 [wastewater metagenome]|nr:hypothetical protein [Candidatus Loosdrechtia aerotolerans]
MMIENRGIEKKFDWKLYPQTEDFLFQQIGIFLENNQFASSLSSRIEQETSTRFFDWIDHIVLPHTVISKKTLEGFGYREAGYNNTKSSEDIKVFFHQGAIFFPVLITEKICTEIALKPERLDHFIQTFGKGITIHGTLYGPYRKAIISPQNDYILSAVERRGYRGFLIPEKNDDVQEYRQALELFLCRRRFFKDSAAGLDAMQKLVENICTCLPVERTADAFLRAERMYWERKNWAGQIQKARQDRLGLGWGNHDHHTYRTSRKNFSRLIQVFETLGFVCREQFFAGEEAGWGAQVMEHPHNNAVLFADVDLLKEEKGRDFSHTELSPLPHHGTVGLWVELHGESILQSGLHHLAVRFDFEKLRTDLKKLNITMMNPFSYFEFLKQAFSEAELWNVGQERLHELFEKNSITKAQYEAFLKNGMKGIIGSHLENIQRNQGFKGFNQRSVSAIIKATDPRKYKVRGA